MKEYETVTDVIENLPKFMEDVYNKKNPLSLGYATPEEFERKILTLPAEQSSFKKYRAKCSDYRAHSNLNHYLKNVPIKILNKITTRKMSLKNLYSKR